MAPDPGNPLAGLPHREPFCFVSRLLSHIPGERAEGVWSLRGDEAFFQGHFPGDPIVPGVLISEALAQLSGLVALHDGQAGRLVHVDVRFDTSVRPPAEILLRSTLMRTLGQLHQFDVAATANGTPVARGTLTLAAGDQQSGA